MILMPKLQKKYYQTAILNVLVKRYGCSDSEYLTKLAFELGYAYINFVFKNKTEDSENVIIEHLSTFLENPKTQLQERRIITSLKYLGDCADALIDLDQQHDLDF
jgi:hypothetical protein